MPMKLILTFILALVVTSTFAQCNTGTDRVDELVVNYNRFEKIIYRKGISNNGDLTQGYQAVYVRFMANKKENGFLVMEVVSVGSGRLPAVIPRRVRVTTYSGLSWIIDATNTRVMDGNTLYVFQISPETKRFFSQPLKEFQVIDTRTQERTDISVRPEYDKLLAEQLACLEKM